MGSIGGPELLLILVVALLVFGPRKLPEIGRTLGRTMAGFRRAAGDFKTDLEREVNMEEVRESTEALRDARQDLRDVASLKPIKEAVGLDGPAPSRPEEAAPAPTSPAKSAPAEAAPADPAPEAPSPGGEPGVTRTNEAS